MLGKHLECSLREHHWDTGILTACATHHLGFSRKSNKNQTQFRVIDHVGPFPIFEARCSFLTSHRGNQKSTDRSCFQIHGKDVNAPNHWSNSSSWRKKPASTQSARKRDTKHKEIQAIYPRKKIVSPEPHKATDTSHSKVLGFVSHLHEMQREALDYTAEGFGASDVQSHQP